MANTTCTIDVTPGSGNSLPIEKKTFILFPQLPVNGKNQVWRFSERNSTEDNDEEGDEGGVDPIAGVYKNLSLYFTPESTGPQDRFIARFRMSTIDGRGWTFEETAITFKDGDPHHDVQQKVTNNGKVLKLTFQFNDEATEALPFFFTATYKNNPGDPISSKDPSIVVDTRPPSKTRVASIAKDRLVSEV